jgi:hypothetical protein
MFRDEIDKKKKNHKNSSQPTNLATQVIHAILFNKFFMTKIIFYLIDLYDNKAYGIVLYEIFF